MKLIIFGATGSTGQCLVEQALAQGHEVTAFVRNPSAITTQHNSLSIVKGDVLDPVQVEIAIADKEAVISAFGVKIGTAPGTVRSEGTKNILAAMKKLGVNRLICITSAGIGDSKPRSGFLGNVLFPLFFKERFADVEKQEQLIQQSGLDWTIVRPSRLTDKAKTGTYQSGLLLSVGLTSTISRADVAAFMLQQLTDNTYLHKALIITGVA